jgi:hypothetical protein
VSTYIPDENGAESESAAIQTFIDGGRLDCCNCGLELTREDGRWLHATAQASPPSCDTPAPIIWANPLATAYLDRVTAQRHLTSEDAGALRDLLGRSGVAGDTKPPAADPLLSLRAFVDDVAQYRRDGEETPDGGVFVWELDEAVDRLNALIGEARRVQDAWTPAQRAIETLSIKDWSERLTCDEVEAVVVAFRAVGCDDPASGLLQSHIESDCAGVHDHLPKGHLSIDARRAQHGTSDRAADQGDGSGRVAGAWRELEQGLEASVDNTGLVGLLGHVVQGRGDEPPLGGPERGLPDPPVPDDPGLGF